MVAVFFIYLQENMVWHFAHNEKYFFLFLQEKRVEHFMKTVCHLLNVYLAFLVLTILCVERKFIRQTRCSFLLFFQKFMFDISNEKSHRDDSIRKHAYSNI